MIMYDHYFTHSISSFLDISLDLSVTLAGEAW